VYRGSHSLAEYAEYADNCAENSKPLLTQRGAALLALRVIHKGFAVSAMLSALFRVFSERTTATRHMNSLVHVALVVRDYDEAIAWYSQKLGFTLVEDTYIPEQDKRWVVVAPAGSNGGCTLLLARAATPEQEKFVGNQTGGRVFLFLSTDDFERDYRKFTAAGVKFVRPPTDAPYGRVAVFEDLYGTRWDLIQYS